MHRLLPPYLMEQRPSRSIHLLIQVLNVIALLSMATLALGQTTAPTGVQECSAFTGAWSDTEPFQSTSGGIGVAISDTRNGGQQSNTRWTGTADGAMNTIDAYSDPAIQGHISYQRLFQWDYIIGPLDTTTSPIYGDGDTGNMTITFSRPVVNPVLHIDRLGGNGGLSLNSARFQVVTPGASITRLAGVTHLITETDRFYRDPVGTQDPLATSESHLDPLLGSAAGSMMFAGSFDELEFFVDGVGVEGVGGDGFEMVICVPQNDLSITHTVNNTTPQPAETITFTTTVTNNGPQSADGVELTGQLPTGLSFVSALTSQGSYDSGTGIWTVGSIADSGTATLTLEANISAAIGATLTHPIEITSSSLTDTDSDPSSSFASDDLADGLADDDEASVSLTIMEFDRGDAPASYGEALHELQTGFLMGFAIDSDIASIASPDASGDGADDDALSITSLSPGADAAVQVFAAGASGFLQGWIDWNRDGDFDDAGEQVITDIQDNSPGDNFSALFNISLGITVPASASLGQTFMRVRWSSTPGLDATTTAPDGEVEDYLVEITPQDPGLTNGNGCVYQQYFDAGAPQYRSAPQYALANATNMMAYHVESLVTTFEDWGPDFSGSGGYMAYQSAGSATDPAAGEMFGSLTPVTVTANTDYRLSLKLQNRNLTNVAVIQAFINGAPVEFQQSATTSQVWQQLDFNWHSGTATSADFSLVNNAVGAAGNDFSIDEIELCPYPDRGDAPDSYSTLAASSGPSHGFPNGLPNLFLGTEVTGERDAVPSASASTDGADDGINEIPDLIAGATSYTIPANSLTAVGTGTLHAWVDFNVNGVFETGEYTSTAVSSGTVASDLVFSGIAVASSGDTFARLRLTADASINSTTPGNIASDGEVEDYQLTILQIDRSDAPLSYGDTYHTRVQGFRMGAVVDIEGDSIASADASGDGATDDGVAFTQLSPGVDATVTVTVSNHAAFLQGWIDWNQDGDFDDANEQIFTNLQDNGVGDNDPTAQVISGTVSVPVGTPLGQTFARLRWSTTASLDATMPAPDGEVEDYLVAIGVASNSDRSDAPLSYGEAFHLLTAGVGLGTSLDSETASIASADATGDGIDDNGIFGFPLLVSGQNGYTIPVENLVAGGSGVLHSWIDFDRNGTFDADEYASTQVTAGAVMGDLVFTNTIGSVGETFARFRMTSDASLTNETPSGFAIDGEVEDYLLAIIELDSPAPNSTQACTELTGSWTTTEPYQSTSGAISVELSHTGALPSLWVKGADDTINTINAFSNPSVQGSPSYNTLFQWDSSPEDSATAAYGDGGLGTLTLDFDQQVSNVVLHVDRLGSFFGSLRLTLASGGTGLERLSGTSHFSVTQSEIYRNLDNGGGQILESSLDPAVGTAAGSVLITGSYSQLTFNVDGLGIEGTGGDSIELAVCVPQIDLSVTNTVDDPNPTIGDVVTFTVTVANDGPQQADNVVVNDSVGTSFDFVSATPSQGTYDPGTNNWSVGSLANGDAATLDVALQVIGDEPLLQRVQVTNASLADVDSDPAAGYTVDDLNDGILDDVGDDDEDALLLMSFSSVQGSVFEDLNVNGIVNPGEPGLEGVTVVLQDTALGTCRSVATAADGSYSFDSVALGNYVVFEAAGEAVPVPTNCPPVAADPTGYLSSNPNFVAISNAIAPQTISVRGFGDVRPPTFAPNNSGVLAPGTSTDYAHQLISNAAGSVDLSPSVVVAPSSSGWSETIYQDLNCNGVLDASDPLVSGPVNLEAGDTWCVLVRVFAPADAAVGTQHSLTLTANFDFNGTFTGSVPIARLDTTQVVDGSGTLQLTKRVINVGTSAANDGGIEQTSNAANPGDQLSYIIYFRNTGVTPINTVRIYDQTPEYTALDQAVACPATLPDSLIACTVNNPAGAANGVGYEGEIEWQLDGELAPGASGSVEYRILVQ